MSPLRLTIMLTTTGARSGAERAAELYAWPDEAREDRLVLVGSSGGSARHPAWVHNLRANPRATVSRGKAATAMRAREVVDPVERERLWELVVERFPLYATYQRRTQRLIPLFVLEATDSAA